jgi:hypothetical protein
MAVKKYHKIIGLIADSKNPQRLEGAQKQWLPKSLPKNTLILIVYGDDSAKTARIEGNNLFLPVPEKWESLSRKILAFLEYCQGHYEFDYIVKIDDDTYVNLPSLLAYCPKGVDYAGRFKHMMKAFVSTREIRG